jgi:hypothetical protein
MAFFSRGPRVEKMLMRPIRSRICLVILPASIRRELGVKPRICAVTREAYRDGKHKIPCRFLA